VGAISIKDANFLAPAPRYGTTAAVTLRAMKEKNTGNRGIGKKYFAHNMEKVNFLLTLHLQGHEKDSCSRFGRLRSWSRIWQFNPKTMENDNGLSEFTPLIVTWIPLSRSLHFGFCQNLTPWDAWMQKSTSPLYMYN